MFTPILSPNKFKIKYTNKKKAHLSLDLPPGAANIEKCYFTFCEIKFVIKYKIIIFFIRLKNTTNPRFQIRNL